MNKSDLYACKRLSEQIKFFGAKPKRFVSIYAKKPRIRVENKIIDNRPGISELAARGMQKSSLGGFQQQGLANQLFGIGLGAASQRAAMAQQAASQQAFNCQRDMFMQQQATQVNHGLSNIGQAGLNSLTGGNF